MPYQWIEGDVCAPKGFQASGVHCGIRKNRSKKDLALIFSHTMCTAASVYTTNKVKGAPILVTKQHLKDGKAQAVLCNSGNANTCNADGLDIANAMCKSAADALDIREEDIVIASTGVIGQPLPLDPITKAMPDLVAHLGLDGTPAAEAIMTTDTCPKQVAVQFPLGGKMCSIGASQKAAA